jgi:N-acetylneuraminate synthase/N,N'-diacetyllegionaminate synthase
METMRRAFGCEVGLSDHTLGITVSLAAVALGATMLERHVTEDVNSAGPDHRFALEPDVIKALVDGCAVVVAALGEATKRPADSELENRLLARRSIHARTDLAAGHVLARDDLSIVRPALGIAPRDLDLVIGRTLKTDVVAGTPLEWSHV